MKKTTKISLWIAALCCVAGLAVATLSLCMMDFDFTKLSTLTYTDNEYTVTQSFSSIQIDTETADVRFLPSGDSTCRVVCYEQEKVPHRVTVEDGTLKVLADDQRSWYDYLVCFDFDSAAVTVYLPAAQYGRLEVTTDTGDLSMPADFAFPSASVSTDTGNIDWRASVEGALTIDTDTGNVKVEGVQLQSLQAETDTGDVRIRQVSTTGETSLKTDTGDVMLEEVTAGFLQIRTHTGDVALENTVAEGSLSLKTDTGDVLFQRFDAAAITVETNTGDVTGTLLSEKIFFVETDTGDVHVPRTDRGGRCEITTDTGDVEITID